jgi:hypothetical protein
VLFEMLLLLEHRRARHLECPDSADDNAAEHARSVGVDGGDHL